MTSIDEKVKKAMRWLTESERRYQIVKKDRNAQFLNWKKEEGRREKNRDRKNNKKNRRLNRGRRRCRGRNKNGIRNDRKRGR
jgi:hypothetical protein